MAKNYDSILEQDSSNKIVRQRVAEKFCKTVEQGWVLDFGGGTGLDMEWLIENGYRVFFCEPSPGMRQYAINYNNNILHKDDIVFLADRKTDFSLWDKEPPFSQKADAILSNFAVINNIQNIKLLFKNIALVAKTGAHLIALILDNSFKKMVRSYFLNNITSFIFQKPVAFHVQGKEHNQIVYIHTTNQIKKASSAYFNFCSEEPLSEFGFVLIHLIKK